MAEVEKGTALDEIIITSITPKGRPTSVKLDKDIWMRSLLRGPTKGQFLEIWNAFSERAVARSDALRALSANFPYFDNNARLFVQDLKFFGSKSDARSRLLSTNHRFFLGEPYFSSAAVEKILALPVEPSTLHGQLDNLMHIKAERGQEEELCASHDLAPIFIHAFSLEWDKLKKQSLTLQRTKDALKRRPTMDTLSRAFSKLTPKDRLGSGQK